MTNRKNPGVLDALQWRALEATAEGITISDVSLPDNPIIYANLGFERLTGYSIDETVGRNCRFLQGADTDTTTVDILRKGIQDGKDTTVEILNYRKDGEPFWNRLSVNPVRNSSGRITHFIGVQSDITGQKRAEQELIDAKKKLDASYKEIKKDLESAARIQRALLPTGSPDVENFQFAWHFEPCTDLAGDFLNVVRLDARHLGVYVLDVSGHGVAAALLSVTLSRWLSANPAQSILFTRSDPASEYEIAPPAEVAEKLNDQLFHDAETSQYFTMIYGILDTETNTFRYVSAGHSGPIHQPFGRPAQVLDSTSAPVGLLEQVEFNEKLIELEPGDRLFLYTDGLTESLSENDEEFGEERILRVLHGSRRLGIRDNVERLRFQAKAWRGRRPATDDTTVVAVEVMSREENSEAIPDLGTGASRQS
jgi:PAS domain S-box-containing protein